MSHTALRRALIVLFLVHDFCTAQYTAIPRWGQATALVEDVLFVQGGRTDEYNSYSYTSAPTNNDLLSISLTSSFNLSSPPWDYVGGCSNCSSSQGPAVSWHTMSAFNSSTLLLFGGDPGPNSGIALPESANSAGLVDINNRLAPIWYGEAQSWAGEPLRRMYHSASSTGGKVYLIGGEKTDGSGTAFSDHYVFDPTTPSFTQLPSTNGPPDIYGHAAIVMPNGSLVIFGGYCQSQDTLLPLTTVWILDTTQSTPSWSTLSVADASLPSPRRGFASTLLDGGKILIQGGADAQMQTTYSDGWILDTTQSPMVWTAVGALSQLGPRRDHFAVGLGSEVIFGFGYASNGPAPAALHVFNIASGSFLTSYTPPSSVTSPTTTTLSGPLPTNPTGTNDPSGSGQTAAWSGSWSGPSGTVRGGPSSSGTPGSGGSGGNHGGSSGNGGNSNSDGSAAGASSKSHATSIALGTVFGVLGLLAGTTATAWYLRRHHSQNSFHMLGGTDDDDSSAHLAGAIPVARSREKNLPPVVQNVKSRLGAIVPGLAPVHHQARRDMLADEDSRHFDTGPWYAGRREASSGQSSWSSVARHATFGDMMYGSLASLRSVGGTMLAYAAGSRGTRSREASAGSRSTSWWGKERPYEPYLDDVGLIRSAAVSRAASRPQGGRQPSHGSAHLYYDDPFADDEIENYKLPGEYFDEDVADEGPPSLADPPPRPYAYIRAPAATVDLTRLSPVAELPSVPTVSDPTTTSDSSHGTTHVPPGSSAGQSRSSLDTSRSPLPRPSSIIDANPLPSEPMRRSNSWWTRFAKAPLLDRRASDASRMQRPLDFRDPNPPPRLVPIEESTYSAAGDSPPSRTPSQRRHMYSSTQHGRSASSLQTARTANSEMVEKMGRTMDIVQKGTVTSHSGGPSTESAESDSTELPATHRPLLPPLELGGRDEPAGPGAILRNLVRSPVEMSARDVPLRSSFPYTAASDRPSPSKRFTTGGQVAARVQAFERRTTQEEETAKSPPALRSKKDRISGYGVAPKPFLFIANPDHRSNASSGSS
ncbi:hypothetical protein AcV5_008246 [Taiwanofungus camphoratus]|nr:hypothetical protein AcV5_008246 [Antrodia cinnamomea]